MIQEAQFQMDKIWVQEVIISTVRRRGRGTEGDPIRIITQIFTKAGDLIAEFDSQLNKIETQ